jgi:hypothetical protein
VELSPLPATAALIHVLPLHASGWFMFVSQFSTKPGKLYKRFFNPSRLQGNDKRLFRA